MIARLMPSDGCNSSMQGRLKVYRHNDMQHLEELLAECPQGHRKLVITDSLFSMDGKMLSRLHSISLLSGVNVLQGRRVFLHSEHAGMHDWEQYALAKLGDGFAGDFADLAALVRLRRKYAFLLALDDAHATFVCGKRCQQLHSLHPHQGAGFHSEACEPQWPAGMLSW